MKKKLVILFIISLTLVTFTHAQKQKVNASDFSHWSLSLKGGADIFRFSPVDHTGTYFKNMSWTFPGLSLEYSINPLFGVGLDATYLNYVRNKSISADLGKANTIDLTAEGSVNLYNLLWSKRNGISKKSNLFATLGGGLGMYSYEKENGETGKGTSPLGTIGLKWEHNLSDALALGAGIQYRSYIEEIMGNKLFQSDAMLGTINLRYKIGANAKQHVLNSNMADYFPAPKPEVIEKPAPPTVTVEKFDNSANLKKIASIEDKNAQLEKEIQKLRSMLEKLSNGGGVNTDGSYNFGNIQFETNSSKLTKASTLIIDNVANIMKSTATPFKLNIAGHTDADGNDDLNQNLSQDRANSVKDYLVSKGISANLMTSAGYGESKPIATNETEEGKAKNRRVEFSITK